MSAPEYRIEKVADFLSVPEDRRAVCLHEFSAWLTLATLFKTSGMEEFLVGESPLGHFTWIDDGKEEACLTGTIAETGEVIVSVALDVGSPLS